MWRLRGRGKLTKDQTMTSVSDIQEAILVLAPGELAELRVWLSELDWQRWDAQIEADSEAGTLDALVDEARVSRDEGTLTPL